MFSLPAGVSRRRDEQTPAALGALQRADIERWWPIIKAANIKPEWGAERSLDERSDIQRRSSSWPLGTTFSRSETNRA